MDITSQELQKAINGEITFKWRNNGSVLPLKLNKKGKELFEQFIKQGFGYKNGTTNAYSVYSVWCSIENQPEVSILSKVKYAHIEIDMIFSNYCISFKGQELIESVVKNNWPKKYEKSALAISAGGTYSSFRFVLKEKAELVARRIVEIIRDKKYLIYNNLYNEEYKNTINENIRKKNQNFRKIGNKKEGYVYFIQAEDRNIFKIGYSKNHPRTRIKSLQNSSPYDLYLRYFFYSIDCKEAEDKVHNYLKNTPQKREWFFISPAQVVKAINYFHSTIDVALDSNNFQVIGKYLVLKSKVQDDSTTVITEKCPFCGHNHRHGSGGKDYKGRIEVIEGIRTLGHRLAHCTKKNIEFITPNGTVVNNMDGYYLGI